MTSARLLQNVNAAVRPSRADRRNADEGTIWRHFEHVHAANCVGVDPDIETPTLKDERINSPRG